MDFATTITDRAVLVQFLHDELDKPVEYAGAPTFNYSIGPYKVLRDATIWVNDDKMDPELIAKMQELGIIEKEKPEGLEFPIGEDALTRINLVNTLAARGSLINKAIGKPNAFFVSRELTRKLKKVQPVMLSEFNAVLVACKGDKALRGITLLADKVVFTGFPEDRLIEEREAFRDLADVLVTACRTSKWLKAEARDAANEKYTFRVWMGSIGLSGKEHSATRRILLERLDGDAAYRTKEQREAALAKHKQKEVKKDDDFIVLG